MAQGMRVIDANSDTTSLDEAGSIVPGRNTVGGHVIGQITIKSEPPNKNLRAYSTPLFGLLSASFR